jgi:hypothetical protein
MIVSLDCAGWRPNKIGIPRAFEVECFKAKGFKLLPDDSQMARIIQRRKHPFRICGLPLSFSAGGLIAVCE